MSVARDIAATWRGPSRVVARLLARDVHEGRALAYLMGACALMFVSQLPRLARQAHLSGEDQNMLMGGALMGWIFIAPLFFYVLAALMHGLARLLGGRGSGFDSRVALFWALLAAAPAMLLQGLVGGFVGQGPQANLVGAVWLAAVGFFWFSGMRTAHRQKDAPA